MTFAEVSRQFRVPVLLLMMFLALFTPMAAFADGVTENVRELSRQLQNPDYAPNIGFAFTVLDSPIKIVQAFCGFITVACLFILAFKVSLDILVVTFPQLQSSQNVVAGGLISMSSFNNNRGRSAYMSYKDYFKDVFLSDIVVGLIFLAVMSSGLSLVLAAKSIDFFAWGINKIANLDVEGMLDMSEQQFNDFIIKFGSDIKGAYNATESKEKGIELYIEQRNKIVDRYGSLEQAPENMKARLKRIEKEFGFNSSDVKTYEDKGSLPEGNN